MRKIILILIALTAAAFVNRSPAHAYGDAPWCAVSSAGQGGALERCGFRDFESCRMEVVAGNRGFCRQSSYYDWQTPSPRKPHRRVYR
jgi:hypothetical protein